MQPDILFVRVNFVSDREIIIHRVEGCYVIPTLAAGYKKVKATERKKNKSQEYIWLGELWYDHLPRIANTYDHRKIDFCQKCYPGHRDRNGRLISQTKKIPPT